ncbi:MAG: hypothetical protein HOC71_11365 [Candidatus Latescibacteria bacterium]|jgi:hypothetical protein|nr:hypothetical protein [Candidatus Latescibacterota bacterium]
MRTLFFFSVVMLTVCLAGAGMAQEKAEPANTAGEWAITINFISGTGNHNATISQDGEKLTGDYKGEFLESEVTGKIEGNKIDFSARLNYMRWGVTFHYKGTVEGDTIKGTVEMDEYWSAPFTAKRKKKN